MSMIHPPRIIQGVKHAMPTVIIKSAKGSYLQTECGRKLLDFSCGIGVTNLGHSHEGVTKAIIDNAPILMHAQQNIFKHRPMVNLVDKLADMKISKSANLNSWFFWNSGSEAIEAAVKLARHATKKPNVIAFKFGYHGRTMGTMALTSSSTVYRAGFGPMMGGTFFADFPYLTHSVYGSDNNAIWKDNFKVGDFNYWGLAPMEVVEKETKRALASFEMLLRTQSAPSETAAVVLEPVLGEGGYVPCPPGFLKGLKEICVKNNILLIADEVQTGFGRTGTMFSTEWIDGGVKPDILVMAKGLANGYPISAMGTREDLAITQTPGSMGGTYGGNAVGCAAALAVFEAFEKENVLDNVNKLHVELVQSLHKIQKKYPQIIREVRGNGLMIGVEFENLPGKAPGATAGAIATGCHNRDMVILTCGPYDTLRFIPPLNITSQDLHKGLKIFEEAVADVATKA